jgi:hypothetical protein
LKADLKANDLKPNDLKANDLKALNQEPSAPDAPPKIHEQATNP